MDILNQQLCNICSITPLDDKNRYLCQKCIDQFCPQIKTKGRCKGCETKDCQVKAHEFYTADKTHCPICQREVPEDCWEKHHLIPRCKNKLSLTILVCVNCGDACHSFFTNNELEKTYNTIGKLLQHDKIKNWVKWLSKRPTDFNICMREKKRK